MRYPMYVAGKIWHAPRFQVVRSLGYNVTSRWIDYDDNHPVVQNKPLLWQHCYEDVAAADFLLLYSEEDDEQRGALVEVGMAMGMNKPIFAINRCKSLRACPISDVAFTHHHSWTWLDSNDPIRGAAEAHEWFLYMNKRAA